MLVDLHVHTSRFSSCSELAPDVLIQRAKRLGLDGIGITEHGTRWNLLEAMEMAQDQGLTIFRGIEIHTPVGDMLIYGVHHPLQQEMDFTELCRAVKEEGGVIIAAHPFRGFWGHRSRHKGHTSDDILFMVDAIETHNGSCSHDSNLRAWERAASLKIPSVGGSDAHAHHHLGRCLTFFHRTITSEEELVREIRSGRCVGTYYPEKLPVTEIPTKTE